MGGWILVAAMSEDENLRIARRVYEVLAGGLNEQTALALVEEGVFDPDGELDLSTAYADGPVVRVETISEFLDTQPWGRTTTFEPESFRAVSGDRVLVFVRVHGIGVGSGVEVEGRFAHLLTIRDGRILRTEVYTDRSRALEAAGLEE
jgi:ketosteroid isomerase-like protein